MRYFTLFACCLPVRGAKRSTICDIQRNDFKVIPNDMYDVIKDLEVMTIEELKNKHDFEHHETIDEYLSFLLDNELGFFNDSPELFPKLNAEYKFPSFVSNSILDYNKNSTYDIENVVSQLDALGCGAVQIRFFDEISCSELTKICSMFNDRRIRSVELLIKFNQTDENQLSGLINISNSFNRVSSIIVHSAPVDEYKYQGIGELGKVMFVRQEITDHTHCGIISPFAFVLNIDMFSESKSFNNCLNNKISIDFSGSIRNCPATKVDYGKVEDIGLSEVLVNPGFRSLWSIKKDLIKVCQDCEFRYMCTDCRAFTVDDSDPYAKPRGCTYDPYRAEWD